MRVARSSAVSVIVCAIVVGGAPAAPASADASAARAACRGPAALNNSLALTAGRKIFIRRVTCQAAQAVVKRFADRCVNAYISQGTCKLKTRKRWRCRSTIVGAATQSSVKCGSRRSRVRFTVKVEVLITRPPIAQVADLGPPYSDRCIDTNAPAQAVPPVDDTYELRTYGRVPLLFGEAVQAILARHKAAQILLLGLGVSPRDFPQRVPVFLIEGPDEGVTWITCDRSRKDASVVTIGAGQKGTASTVMHELTHSYSAAVKVTPAPFYQWFEDPLAEWATWKANLQESNSFEVWLQYPDRAFDTVKIESYRYALWRWLQFLDDKEMMVAGDQSWPLARGTLAGTPAYAATLDRILTSLGTRLGAEIAAFWGEHLKAKPNRPPRLVPTPPENATQIKVSVGRRTETISAKRLHTNLVDFKLARDVRRVEFEFEPPADGYFWGLTAPDTSRQFKKDEAVSFCVGGADNDDLEWPKHFAVTFTNGLVSNSTLRGKVHIYAQASADQCTAPKPNRACTILRRAGAESVLGPKPPEGGGFGAGGSGVERGRPYVLCTYTGLKGLGVLIIERWGSSTDLRRTLTRRAKAGGWRPVHFGDAAYILDTPNHAFLNIAVGRDKVGLEVSNDKGPTSQALRLGQRIVPLVR